MHSQFQVLKKLTNQDELVRFLGTLNLPSFEREGVILYRLIYPETLTKEQQCEVLTVTYNPSNQAKVFYVVIQTPLSIILDLYLEKNKEDLQMKLDVMEVITAPSLSKGITQYWFKRFLAPNSVRREIFKLVPNPNVTKNVLTKLISGKRTLEGLYEIIVTLGGSKTSGSHPDLWIPQKPVLPLIGLKSTVEIRT